MTQALPVSPGGIPAALSSLWFLPTVDCVQCGQKALYLIVYATGARIVRHQHTSFDCHIGGQMGPE